MRNRADVKGLLGQVLIIALLIIGLFTGFVFPTSPALSEESSAKEFAAQLEEQRKQQTQTEEILTTLSSLIKSVSEQEKNIKSLKKQLQLAKEDATKKELEKEIAGANEQLEQVNNQISALSTGVSAEEISGDKARKFNLQSELESLAQPFVKMMKDATENARQTERLKGLISEAEQNRDISQRAMERVDKLLISGKHSPSLNKSTKKYLTNLQQEWKKRLQQADNQKESARQQLNARMEENARSSGGLGNFTSQFLRNRGLNLLLALSAFTMVFLIMNLISRVAGWLWRRAGRGNTFTVRLARLLFWFLTILLAFLAMLFVFNLRHDWLLLGLGAVFALALLWIGLKMLPTMSEQITMLLNLGAVQEGERLMFNGVPWKVEKLDFYTDLVNPDLDGGTFTLPVRELVGLHSRPAARDESWFPTRKGDWIRLEEQDILGEVISQTPELVQIRELGGSLVTFETTAFLSTGPRNLSTGFRIQTEIGLDYQHQPIATTKIPSGMKEFVQTGLTLTLEKEGKKEGLINVDVDLIGAGASSLLYEVEAAFTGELAPAYEELQKEIMTLILDACNKHNWKIPFPQLVIHKNS